ncbi:MAG TPA: Hsp70 family protein, partial [Thioalkalivibrio sp.]|nr:Hsp70 family protein [Thioalkalivibrio sp.]
PAPRGVPQVEVTFDIDANGILHVSAKDKATGKENRIVIKASSGLSDDEVEKMVKDAEAHAEEDKRFHALVAARNQADALVHSAEKSLKDLSDQVEADERTAIEAAINEVREAMKGDDTAAIEAATQKLAEASGKLAERAYAKASEGADASAGGGEGPAGGGHDDVVDAEFEEVDDKKQ